MTRTIQYEDPDKNGSGKKGLRELSGDDFGPNVNVKVKDSTGADVPSGGASDPVNVVNGTEQHTFHNAATAAADGTDFTNAGYKTLRVIIKSTVTPATRQVDFLGAIDDTFVAINGFKAPDYGTEDDGTTGTGSEVWLFDIEGFEEIRMDLTTLTGASANTTIIGVAS